MIPIHGVYSVRKLPFYKKAIEVYALSRNVTLHLAPEKTIVDLQLSESEFENCLDELVVHSLSIAPQIAIAQTTKDSILRYKTIKRIAVVIDQLRAVCNILTAHKKANSDYILLLRKELSILKGMHLQWSALLSQQN